MMEELLERFGSSLAMHEYVSEQGLYKWKYLVEHPIFKLDKVVQCVKYGDSSLAIMDMSTKDMDTLNKLLQYLARNEGFNTVSQLVPGYTVLANMTPLTTYWNVNKKMIKKLPTGNFKAQVALEIAGLHITPNEIGLSLFVDQVKVLEQVKKDCIFA